MSEKSVLFDLSAVQENSSGKRHGGAKYGEIVFVRMLERGLRPACFYRSSLWINPSILETVNKNGLPLYDLDSSSLDEIIIQSKCDILFSCLPTGGILDIKDCKVKVILHGLRTIEEPLDPFFWKYKNNSLKQKAVFFLDSVLPTRLKTKEYLKYLTNPQIEVAVVSNHTANAIRVYFPEYGAHRLPVFYSPSTSSKTPCSKRVINEKFFLLVSGNRWEKNCLRAIMALDRLFKDGFLKDFKVKVTGAKDACIYRYKIQNPDRFDFLGYVSESELEQLYHDAFVLLYPSLNEGFGYPPLEAMRYGVPVIASPFSSIPEVCQGAAIYFNPFSIEEIMNRALLISSNEELYDECMNRSLSQYETITDRQRADLDKLIDWIAE